MQNRFFCSSNVQQEMEFQIVSTLPVKLCQTASLSYTSRALHCAHYLPLYYYYQCKTCPFDNSISYVEQEIHFQLGIKLPVKSSKIASLS